MGNKGTLRICEKGHKFYKSTDCPTCPICEKNKAPKAEFLSKLSAPARRALEREDILTLKKLSGYSEKDLLDLHGLGPSSIPKLKDALEKEGLSFRKN
ncbi:RNA polymerase alpha subunit C-terminal domain-containing protein [Algoriphagus aestuarii]|nr:RNA polymerase alpha subunit C-terminal domain-containing protein [Algoriphagus aestuarii]